MGRMPGAVWDPLAADWNQQPRMQSHDILCWHTMVGSLEGTDAYFRFSNGRGYDGTESHFGTGYDGRIEQWQDTLFQADANLAGNGTVVSVENADVGRGFPVWDLNDGRQVPAFTDAQVEANIRIGAWFCSPAAHASCPPGWACRSSGVPAVLIPDTLPGRRGLAYHRQGVDPWRVSGGVRWSSAYGKVCPGDRRISQIKSEIIPEIARIVAGGEIMAKLDPEDLQNIAAAVWNYNLGATKGGTEENPVSIPAESAKNRVNAIRRAGVSVRDWVDDLHDGEAPATQS